MLKKLLKLFSFGEKYFLASFIYIGLGLVVSNLLPPNKPLQASGSGCPEVVCPPGNICCQGNCIPDSYVCCDDGSSGPGTTEDGKTCGYCSDDCSSEECSNPTSYNCM
jgi:hypothetical protein